MVDLSNGNQGVNVLWITEKRPRGLSGTRFRRMRSISISRRHFRDGLKTRLFTQVYTWCSKSAHDLDTLTVLIANCDGSCRWMRTVRVLRLMAAMWRVSRNNWRLCHHWLDLLGPWRGRSHHPAWLIDAVDLLPGSRLPRVRSESGHSSPGRSPRTFCPGYCYLNVKNLLAMSIYDKN